MSWRTQAVFIMHCVDVYMPVMIHCPRSRFIGVPEFWWYKHITLAFWWYNLTLMKKKNKHCPALKSSNKIYKGKKPVDYLLQWYVSQFMSFWLQSQVVKLENMISNEIYLSHCDQGFRLRELSSIESRTSNYYTKLFLCSLFISLF